MTVDSRADSNADPFIVRFNCRSRVQSRTVFEFVSVRVTITRFSDSALVGLGKIGLLSPACDLFVYSVPKSTDINKELELYQSFPSHLITASIELTCVERINMQKLGKSMLLSLPFFDRMDEEHFLCQMSTNHHG